MFIITEKENNTILHYGEKLDYMSNGYPRLVNEDIAFPDDMVNIYEAEVSEDIVAEKWCYNGAEFYHNENYVELLSDFDRGYEQALLDLMEMESEVTE